MALAFFVVYRYNIKLVSYDYSAKSAERRTLMQPEKTNRLFLVMGKSATGKDHIYKALLEKQIGLVPVVPYTTRPMRETEAEGVEYHFLTAGQMEALDKEGKIIERRCYQTVMGPWYYMTVDDGQIDLTAHSSLLIVTPEAYGKLRDYFGKDYTVPIYIESPDAERLKRSIKREEKQEKPVFAEVCRRYLADEQDFSEEVLTDLGIIKRFENIDFDACVQEVAEYIKETAGI